MQILKFGGSSVSSPERIKSLSKLVQQYSKNEKVVVVFSAFGGVTNDLLSVATLARDRDDSYKELLTSIEKRHLEVDFCPASCKLSREYYPDRLPQFHL